MSFRDGRAGKDGVKKNSSGRQVRGRRKHVKVYTARKRTNSSAQWLARQLNDPYVAEAQKLGYRCRAVFKILELDDDLNLFKPGFKIVDLGAAPGGWTEVAVERVCSQTTDGKVVGIDYLEMEPITGATILQKDFLDDDAPAMLKEALGGKAHVVMSDMAPPTTGHKNTDHIRIMNLVELAYHFAKEVLLQDGIFVAKVFQGGTQNELLTLLKKDFKRIKHIKPKSSRKDSSETYVVAIGYRGKN